MTRNSICRCVVLVAAMACSLPLATDASHVRGGQDLPNCTTSATNAGGACSAKTGQMCPGNKTVCIGCTNMAVLTALCVNDGGNPCVGNGCIAGQQNSELSGASCVNQVCPN
jgi:hypothetical protein